MKLTVLICVLLTFVGCTNSPREAEEATSIQENNKVEFTDLDGTPVELSAFADKTVFLNFWATWCKPCIAEMPSIENARKLLKDEPIVFLLASDEPKEKVEKFKNSHDFEFKYILLKSPIQHLDIMALPTTRIISPDGEIVFSEMGGREWDSEENLALITKFSNITL